ncbi:metallophosphoesterase family protein [Desertibaculum subflavum]|uniref:metallophosphoesterase family protein n=1 Tax=Desertibaculum subflavum TaxID=2268458 RepID=UPI000E673452
MTFRIAQISDTHLSLTKPYFVENFRGIAAALGAARPDLVINTGDVSLDGAGREEDLAAARGFHEALRLRWRAIPGNHDVGDNQEVASGDHHPVDPNRQESWQRHFGADWWRMDLPGWRLIAVNAQIVGSDLAAADVQHSFVAEAAAGAGQRQIALFIHKPLCDRALDETTVGGRFLNPAPRARLLAALGPRRPALIASGHTHQYRSSEIGGARHVWAPSTAFVLPDAYQPRYGTKEVGFVEHRLHADGRHDSRFVRVDGVRTLNIADFPGAYGPIEPRWFATEAAG